MQKQLDGSPAAMRLDVARAVEMMGSEDALRSILDTVVISMSADVPAIDSALQTGDILQANRILHAIKGYMPIFGTDALIEQVAAVEQLSKTQTAVALQAPYQQLQVELQSLLSDMRDYLNAAP